MIDVRIHRASQADRQRWDDYVLSHPAGTAYQLFAWQEAVASAYGFHACSLLASDTMRLRGVLPFSVFRCRPLSNYLISLPYCDAGGVLADDAEMAALLLQRSRLLALQAEAGWQLRSLTPQADAGANHSDKARLVLELPSTMQELLAGLKAKVRSQVNKPGRDGLKVRFGAAELLDDFYRIFAENMRDLGSPVHHRRWFAALLAAYGCRAQIAVVDTPAGEPAAAAILLLHPVTAVVPWASCLRRFNHLNANMLLYRGLLSRAIEQGCQRFDFGRSTPGSGTWRFKLQWGAEPQPLYWYQLRSSELLAAPAASDPPAQSAGLARRLVPVGRQLAETLWTRMPLPAANVLGPAIRKHIAL
ncbi:GNAT family N-acetyltransferase [Desulfuromonas thiophila]|uniref:GNAT family N-acetyltransferase n=1 Tax=Desulfuromonas thiophila TaxID=57664 RepID=UPI0024A90D69|nr:GNAT family N-acetyltransferase [Desulfuromonas thiophila]